MARPSKIDRLPAEIREEIGNLRSNGRTIDEIMAKLRELQVDVSRSGLARHVQDLDQLAEQLRQSRATAEALVARFGDAPENRTARLNIEMLQSVIMRFFVGEDGQPPQISVKEANFIADSLHRLARAAKDDADLQVQIRKQARIEMAEKLKELEAKEGKAGRALDPDTLRRVREIYGIA
jgi:hypothetical protein